MLYCELVARPIEGSEMMIQRTSNDKQANSMMKKKRLGQNVYSISIVYKIKHVTLVFKSFFSKASKKLYMYVKECRSKILRHSLCTF